MSFHANEIYILKRPGQILIHYRRSIVNKEAVVLSVSHQCGSFNKTFRRIYGLEPPCSYEEMMYWLDE